MKGFIKYILFVCGFCLLVFILAITFTGIRLLKQNESTEHWMCDTIIFAPMQPDTVVLCQSSRRPYYVRYDTLGQIREIHWGYIGDKEIDLLQSGGGK